jgi:hypothetical protein
MKVDEEIGRQMRRVNGEEKRGIDMKRGGGR